MDPVTEENTRANLDDPTGQDDASVQVKKYTYGYTNNATKVIADHIDSILSQSQKSVDYDT